MRRVEKSMSIVRPMHLESNRSYPPMEVWVRPEFRFTPSEVVGGSLTYAAAVVAPQDVHNVEIPLLRVKGFEQWDPRFMLNYKAPEGVEPYTQSLWEMAGLQLYANRDIHIGAIEVDGLPIGLRSDSSQLVNVESGLFRRTGRPIDFRGFPLTHHPDAFALGNIVTIDGRAARDLGPPDAWPSRTAIEYGDTVMGKSGSYLVGEDYSVESWVQQGDSFVVKASGTRFVLIGLMGAHVYLNGAVYENQQNYPTRTYLHKSEECFLIDSKLVGSSAAFIDHVLLRVSCPFSPHLTVRGCTFIKGGQATHAAQINWTHVKFERCTFFGWTGPAQAFQCGQADPAKNYPAGTYDCDSLCTFRAA